MTQADLPSPLGPPRALVLDMDGLIFDTEPHYFAAQDDLLRAHGLRFTPDLAHEVMGRPPQQAMARLQAATGVELSIDELVAGVQRRFLALAVADLRVLPGVLDLLHAAEAAGWPRAIATSSAGLVARTLLEQAGLLERVHFVLTAEDVVHGKPHPEMYLLACTRLGLEPSEVVVLEDSQNGVRAAAAAGCRAVAVPNPLARSLDFSVASLVVDSVADDALWDFVGLPRPSPAP